MRSDRQDPRTRATLFGAMRRLALLSLLLPGAEAFDTALRERGKSFHTFDDVLPERAISEVIAHYFNVYKIDACVAKRNKKAAEKAAGKQTAPPELSASQQKPYALELGSPKRLLVAVRPTPPA